MILNLIELTILVKGKPIFEYPHQGQTFIEGRAGSEYEIELCNRTPQKIEAIISVDGLSVIDGKPAGYNSQGYLVPSRQSVRIPGWMVNSQTVAKFAFSGMNGSYTAQSGGDPRNNGVIGVMAFGEKVPVYNPAYLSAAPPSDLYRPRGIGISANTATGMSVASAECFNATSCDVSSQNLGTAFGESHSFATRTVAFQRGDQIATLLCYYDSAKGLRARGITVRRREPRPIPNAFPREGCTPPPNWQG